MSFLDVFNSLHTLLVNSSYLSYVDDNLIWKGFRENIPNQYHVIILEPGIENEDENVSSYNGVDVVLYNIDIYARVILPSSIEASIIGTTLGSLFYKGSLAFIDDIKTTIRKDRTLGYSRNGTSVSDENASGTFALLPTARYITVSINGRTPTGYNLIDCGSSTLTGAQVAANIQTSLRALGLHADDGYYTATCTWDGTTKNFTISSIGCGPRSKVNVTAGASNDCSSLLGFDNPTELVGRNIIEVKFGPVLVDNKLYPVRYRIIQTQIIEEIYDE